MAAGGGASTLTQQTVKNVFLWPARSWLRKAFEAVLTPLVEVLWSKKRILEVYLNVAEFGTGVFGVGAASRHYFGVEPKKPYTSSGSAACGNIAVAENVVGRQAHVLCPRARCCHCRWCCNYS